VRGGIGIELFEPEEAVVPRLGVYHVNMPAGHGVLDVHGLIYIYVLKILSLLLLLLQQKVGIES
jgi:hypothetical protein